MESSSSKKVKFEHLGNWTDAVLSSAFVESPTNDCYAPDVVLKIGPEKDEYMCHRLVLAASSDFLNCVLEQATPGAVPVMLLPDIASSVIEYVITYLYYGEVHVPPLIFPEFYAACQLLQLKGPIDDVKLVTVNEDEDDEILEDTSEWETNIEDTEERQEMYTTIDDDNGDELEMQSIIQKQPQSKEILTAGRKRNVTNMIKTGTTRFDSIYVEATPRRQLKTLESLILCVQRAYNAFGIVLTPQYRAKIRESMLVIEDEKIIRGITDCIYCNLQIRVSYRVSKATKFVVFSNHVLKMHLKKVHGISDPS